MNLYFAVPHLAQGTLPFGEEPLEPGNKPKRFLDKCLRDPSAKGRAPQKNFCWAEAEEPKEESAATPAEATASFCQRKPNSRLGSPKPILFAQPGKTLQGFRLFALGFWGSVALFVI